MTLNYAQEQDIMSKIGEAQDNELHPLSIFFSIGHGLEKEQAEQYRLDILKYLVEIKGHLAIYFKGFTDQAKLDFGGKPTMSWFSRTRAAFKSITESHKNITFDKLYDGEPISTYFINSPACLEYLSNTFNLDINLKNKDGETPLMTAAAMVSVDSVKWLIEKGADMQMQNNKKDNFLHSIINQIKYSSIDRDLPRYIELIESIKDNPSFRGALQQKNQQGLTPQEALYEKSKQFTYDTIDKLQPIIEAFGLDEKRIKELADMDFEVIEDWHSANTSFSSYHSAEDESPSPTGTVDLDEIKRQISNATSEDILFNDEPDTIKHESGRLATKDDVGSNANMASSGKYQTRIRNNSGSQIVGRS